MITKDITSRISLSTLRFWSAIPLLFLASVYVLGLRTAFLIGHLPVRFATDTPDEAFCQALVSVTMDGFYALLLSPFFWTLFFGLNFRQLSPKARIIYPAIFTFGWGLLVVLSQIDSRGILGWWLD